MTTKSRFRCALNPQDALKIEQEPRSGVTVIITNGSSMVQLTPHDAIAAGKALIAAGEGALKQ